LLLTSQVCPHCGRYFHGWWLLPLSWHHTSPSAPLSQYSDLAMRTTPSATDWQIWSHGLHLVLAPNCNFLFSWWLALSSTPILQFTFPMTPPLRQFTKLSPWCLAHVPQTSQYFQLQGLPILLLPPQCPYYLPYCLCSPGPISNTFLLRILS